MANLQVSCPRSNLWSKAFVSLALLVTTVISTTVLILSVRRVYNHGSLVSWVQNSRATIQIIVHLVSATLAALQLYVLGGFVLFRTNLELVSKSLSLDSLKLYQALNYRKLDHDLPFRISLVTIAWLVVLETPGALWAGAISPVLTTTNVPSMYRVPFWNESSSAAWNQAYRPAVSYGGRVTHNVMDLGTFTNIPWKFLPGILVNSISVASSSNALIPQYPKLDRSGFSFYGRSYGVAARVGLTSDPTTTTTTPGQAHFVENYTFSETGYLSDVSCIFNETSDVYFEDLAGVDGGTYGGGNWSGYVVVQQATGSLPTGPWQGFTIMAIADNCTVIALAAGHNDTHYIYGLAAGYYYPNLTNVQCKVNLTPTLFDIAVNVSTSNISVIPAADQSRIIDIDPTRGLVNNTFTSLNYLSQIITTMYTSVLGDAFMVNVDAVKTRENHTTITESDVLTAVSESLELLLDEYFGALAASQIMQYNESIPVNATMCIAVVQLGEPVYAYITFGINLALVLLFLYESTRTRFWQNLPAFNVLDTKSAVLGATRDVIGRHLPKQAQA